MQTLRSREELDQEIASLEKLVIKDRDKYVSKLATALAELAFVHLVDHEKIEALERALSLFEVRPPVEANEKQNHAKTLLGLSILGDQCDPNRFDRSLDLLGELAQQEQLEPAIFYGIVESLDQRAKELPKDWRQSMEKMCEVLCNLREDNPSDYSQLAGLAQTSLGTVYSQLGEYEHARAAHAKAVEIYQSQEGTGANLSLVKALNFLALALDKLQCFREARECCERAVNIAEKHKCEDLAISFANLGLMFEREGKLVEARHQYTMAIDLFDELVGDNSPKHQFKLAHSLTSRGHLLRRLKLLEESGEDFERALQIYDGMDVEPPEQSSSALIAIAELKAINEEWAAAVEYLLRVINMFATNDRPNADKINRTLNQLMAYVESSRGSLRPLDTVELVYERLASDWPLEFGSQLSKIRSLKDKLSRAPDLTSNTYSRLEPCTCPYCSTPFTAELFHIIDAEVRADLFARFQEEKIHEFNCPQCGSELRVDAPLVLYRPNVDPEVVFVPARETSAAEDEKQSSILLNLLRESLGESWNERWLNPLTSVSHEMCRFTFSDDGLLLHPMAIAALSEATIQFCNATSWDDARDVLNQYPDLLQPVADKMIRQLLLDAPVEVQPKIRESLDLLEQCRTQGIEQTFLERKFTSKSGSIDDEVIQAIGQFVDALTWDETRTVLEKNREILLSDGALEALELARDGTPQISDFFEQHVRILKVAREHSIDVAFYDIGAPKIDPVRASKPLREFLHAQTWEESLAALTKYGDDVLEDWSDELGRAIEQLNLANSIEGVPYLQLHQRILTNAARHGIESAMSGLGGTKQNPFFNSQADPKLEIVSTELAIRERKLFADFVKETGNEVSQQIWELLRFAFDETVSTDFRIQSFEQFLKHVDKNTFPAMWSAFGAQFSNLLVEQANTSQHAQNTERAVGICTEIVDVLANRPDDEFRGLWGNALLQLGEAYRNRQRGDRRQNKETAISKFREAMTVFPRDTKPNMWGQTHHYLGNAYSERIEGDPAKNMEEAIRHFELALEVRLPNTNLRGWAMSTVNLGSAYTNRVLGDRTQNIERAIGLYRESISRTHAETEPTEWAQAHLNLGLALRDRVTGDPVENLRAAIESFESALQIWKPETRLLSWMMVKAGLASTYMHLENPGEEYDKAIGHYEEILQFLKLDNAPDYWAAIHHNLGAAYVGRSSRQPEDLRIARDYIDKALRYYTRDTDPERWAIGQMLLGRLEIQSGPDEKNMDKAIDLLQQSLSVLTPFAHPRFYIAAAKELGAIHFERRDWHEAAAAYEGAWKALEFIYDMAVTDFSRNSTLEDNSVIAGRSAYCLTKLGRPERAVERLETSRTRSIAELLDRDRAELQQVAPDDRIAFLEATNELRSLEVSERRKETLIADDREAYSVEQATELQVARQNLLTIVQRVRTYLPDFMFGSESFESISSLSEDEAPFVYLVTTSLGSMAIVVPKSVTVLGRDHIVWLDQFDTEILSEILLHQSADGEGIRGFMLAQMVPEIAKSHLMDHGMLDATLTQLQERIGVELVSRLQALGHSQIQLIPCGRLALLPISAAVIDTMAVSFAPSARMRQFAKDDLQADFSPIVLGIGNPLPHAKPLVFAAREVLDIEKCFPAEGRRILLNHEASRNQVLKLIDGCTHLHFACHGSFDHDEPQRSGLELGSGDRLTLADLLDGGVDLSSTRLAFLSACVTGVIGSRVPDETVGLPLGFIFAGVPNVISTLWPIDDLSGAIFAGQFYRLHLEQQLTPVDAFRKAQIWLRDSTAAELGVATYFAQIYEESNHEDAAALAQMRYFQRCSDATPYSHPYYWAAYVLQRIGVS